MGLHSREYCFDDEEDDDEVDEVDG